MIGDFDSPIKNTIAIRALSVGTLLVYHLPSSCPNANEDVMIGFLFLSVYPLTPSHCTNRISKCPCLDS